MNLPNIRNQRSLTHLVLAHSIALLVVVAGLELLRMGVATALRGVADHQSLPLLTKAVFVSFDSPLRSAVVPIAVATVHFSLGIALVRRGKDGGIIALTMLLATYVLPFLYLLLMAIAVALAFIDVH